MHAECLDVDGCRLLAVMYAFEHVVCARVWNVRRYQLASCARVRSCAFLTLSMRLCDWARRRSELLPTGKIVFCLEVEPTPSDIINAQG